MLLQTSFMLAGDGVPKVWDIALSPNKAYAAVVQSVPGDPQKLQVQLYAAVRLAPHVVQHHVGCKDIMSKVNDGQIIWSLQCAVYSLAKPKRAKILRIDPKYSQSASIQAVTFR